MNGGRGAYKARKTPTAIYPAVPRKVPPSIVALYHSIDANIIEQTEAGFHDQIVTSQILYKPAILAAARINFHGNRWQIHCEKEILRIVPFPSKHQFCEWETNLDAAWRIQDSRSMPEPDSVFAYDSTYDFSAERFEELQEDFRQHLTSTEVLTVEYNPHFKMDRKPGESAENFMTRCMERAREEFDKESQNVEETLLRLQDRLKQRLEREMRDIDEEQQNETERHDSNTLIGDIKKEMEAFQNVGKAKRNEFEENLASIANERENDVLRLHLNNLTLLRFTLIWLPYTEYVIQEKDSRRLELIPSF